MSEPIDDEGFLRRRTALGLLNDAPVSLQLSLSPVTLPLDEARTLRSGMVLDLGMPLPQVVAEVRIGGQLVGHGTLVLVGDHAGVRLRLLD